MTPAQQAAEKIKELSETLCEAYINWDDPDNTDREAMRAAVKNSRKILHAAIDELAAECDRLRGLASLADEERLEIARRAIKMHTTLSKARVKPTVDEADASHEAYCKWFFNTPAVERTWEGCWKAAAEHSAQTGSYFPTPKPEDCKATGDFTVAVKTGEVKP